MLQSIKRSLLAYGSALLLAGLTLASVLPATAATPTGWLHTKGSRILDSTGRDHVIRATSWFGLETSGCAPHGLWQISLDQGLAQIASMGFNTVRLPFSNECLASSSATGIDYAKNPALEGRTPLQVMDAVVARAKLYGLSVILDRHRPSSAEQSALWYTPAWSEARWISDWTMLAKRYASDATVIGVDLHNEPRDSACWGCGDPARDWAAAATRAGNAVLKVNPRLLVLVEGVEEQRAGPTTWWGGGLADARKRPVVLAVANQLVYSTHDYPASVFAQTWFKAKDYPRNLPGVWRASWGYLQEGGTAPVLLGEFGTTLQTTSDQQWLATLVEYVRVNKMSFAYWSFNPNSGDTGGLVKDDWTTPQQAKLAALRPILGAPRTITPVPFPGPKPTPSPSATARPTASATPTPSATRTPSATAAPTPSPSSPTTAPAPGGTTSAAATSAAPGTAATTHAAWQTQSAWPGGYVATLTLTSDLRRHGWSVRWSDPAATSVSSAWGMTCTVSAGSVSCTGDGYGADLAPGQPVRVGVQVATAGTPPAAPTLTLG